MDDTTCRAHRERSRYNQGLKRRTYNRILRHCGAYSKQTGGIKRAMRHAHGSVVLELGCSAWADWIDRDDIHPKRLCVINISETELDNGRKLAPASRLTPTFFLMDGHFLAFADNTFDLVYGDAILHHLDLDTALPEIKRVLRPGGRIVFREPLGVNPIAKLVRWLTPAARTSEEQPFRRRELNLLRDHFDCIILPYQFFAVPLGVLSGLLMRNRKNGLTRLAGRLDDALIRRVPQAGIFYRQFTLVGTALGRDQYQSLKERFSP